MWGSGRRADAPRAQLYTCLTGENRHICGPMVLRVPSPRALSPCSTCRCAHSGVHSSLAHASCPRAGTWTPPLRDAALCRGPEGQEQSQDSDPSPTRGPELWVLPCPARPCSRGKTSGEGRRFLRGLGPLPAFERCVFQCPVCEAEFLVIHAVDLVRPLGAALTGQNVQNALLHGNRKGRGQT